LNKVIDISTNSNRRTQLKNDLGYLHIMKYMGSKRELLPEIKKAVFELCDKGETILDIFAGTASVGAYLKDNYNIISNDIQAYSQVLGDAIITSSACKSLPNVKESLCEIKRHYEVNQLHLQNILKETLFQSDQFISIEKNTWTEKNRKNYLKFISNFPSPVNTFYSTNSELQLIYKMYLENNNIFTKSLPYFQTTFLFSEVYFSLRQAIDIDSIVYAIDCTFSNKVYKNIYLSALIYAYSYCSSGTGHFAMFRDLKSISSVEDVFIYRKRDVWEYFEQKLLGIYDFHNYYPDRKYLMMNKDYVDILQSTKYFNDVKLIYADPPYSFVHYSRFYHAIESLVKYDYNIPQFKGRYRDDRHQSPFCQKQNVESAFELLFHYAHDNNSNVLLSYCDTGMISLENILNIGERNSFTIEVQEIKYNHSTMGRVGHKSNKISEYLIKARL